MTTNEKIAKWLGFKKYKCQDGMRAWLHDEKEKNLQDLDFLHDRNQQKWIIDELIKRGCRIKTTISEYGTKVHIWHNDYLWETVKKNDEIDDTAFISAVLELIEKENAR